MGVIMDIRHNDLSFLHTGMIAISMENQVVVAHPTQMHGTFRPSCIHLTFSSPGSSCYQCLQASYLPEELPQEYNICYPLTIVAQ